MSQHPNARLTPRGRETLVSRIGSGAGVAEAERDGAEPDWESMARVIGRTREARRADVRPEQQARDAREAHTPRTSRRGSWMSTAPACV